MYDNHNYSPNPLDNYNGDNWFVEQQSSGVRLQIKIKKKLFEKQSEFQYIEVYDTYEFGRMLTLDGLIMLTERDEFAYHEMMVHVPMLSHAHPRNVLVIGGGDGGCLRELVKYPSIENIVQVEIDAEVVNVSRKFFPNISSANEHPKVNIVIDDALDYIKWCKTQFDIVIVDGSDPVGPAVKLFESNFIRNIYSVLSDDGIMVNQLGSPLYDEKRVNETLSHMNKSFYFTSLYVVHIPTYPSGVWGIGFGAKNDKFLKKPDEVSYLTIIDDLKYYNLGTHRAAFILPDYMHRSI